MAKFDYQYRKSINITSWVLQILVSLILLGASAWLMAIVSDDEYEDVLGEYSGLFTAAAAVQIAVTSLTIILDIAEIILIARKRMQPALYLTSACIKTLIWGAFFIMSLISLSLLSIVLTVVLAGTSILQLIYGAMLVHRKRRGTLRGGNYAPAAAHPPGQDAEASAYGHNHVYGGPVPPAAYGAGGAGNNNNNSNNSNNNNSPVIPASYYQPPPPLVSEYKPQVAPAPAPAPAPATPPPHYGRNTGSYELDSRVHG